MKINLKALEKFIKPSLDELFQTLGKVPSRKNVKYLVRKSILPGEHPSITGLKAKIIAARGIMANAMSEQQKFPKSYKKEAMQEINNQVKKVQSYYKDPEWKKKAMLFGMTKEEADEVSKFLSSNPDRFMVERVPLPVSDTHGYTEAGSFFNKLTSKIKTPSVGGGLLN